MIRGIFLFVWGILSLISCTPNRQDASPTSNNGFEISVNEVTDTVFPSFNGKLGPLIFDFYTVHHFVVDTDGMMYYHYVAPPIPGCGMGKELPDTLQAPPFLGLTPDSLEPVSPENFARFVKERIDERPILWKNTTFAGLHFMEDRILYRKFGALIPTLSDTTAGIFWVVRNASPEEREVLERKKMMHP